MAFKRMIDAAALYEDDGLWQALGDRGVLAYIRMWGIAESTGIMEHNAQSITRKCGAMNATVKEVEEALLTLIKLNKVIPLKFEGKALLWVKNVPKHNHLKRTQKTKLPIPPFVKEVKTPKGKETDAQGNPLLYFYNYEIDYELADELLNPESTVPEYVPEPSENRPGTVPVQPKVREVEVEGEEKLKGRVKEGKGCGEGEPSKKGAPPTPPSGGEVPLSGDPPSLLKPEENPGPPPFQKMVKAWNDHRPENLPRIKLKGNGPLIKEAWEKHPDLEWWKTLFQAVALAYPDNPKQWEGLSFAGILTHYEGALAVLRYKAKGQTQGDADAERRKEAAAAAN